MLLLFYAAPNTLSNYSIVLKSVITPMALIFNHVPWNRKVTNYFLKSYLTHTLLPVTCTARMVG